MFEEVRHMLVNHFTDVPEDEIYLHTTLYDLDVEVADYYFYLILNIEFGFELTSEDMCCLRTVGDLVKLVELKKSDSN